MLEGDDEVPGTVALSDEEISTILDEPTTDPATAPPEATPPAESAAPASDQPAPDATAPTPTAAPAASPTSPAESPKPEPFAFRVDGTDVNLPGVVRLKDGTVQIPKDVWDRQFQGHLLANRGVWRQKEQGFQRTIQQLQTSRGQKEAEASHVLGEMGKLLTPGNEEALVQFVQNLQVNGPALMAKAEAAGVKAQLEALQSEQKNQLEEQHREAAIPLLQNSLGMTLERYLEQPEFAALKPEGPDLLRHLWDFYRDKLFQEDPLGHVLLPNGERVAINTDALETLLRRDASVRTRLVQQTTTASSVTQRNAAALAPTPVVGKKPSTSGTPKQKASVETARDFKGRFMSWDPTRDDDL